MRRKMANLKLTIELLIIDILDDAGLAEDRSNEIATKIMSKITKFLIVSALLLFPVKLLASCDPPCGFGESCMSCSCGSGPWTGSCLCSSVMDVCVCPTDPPCPTPSCDSDTDCAVPPPPVSPPPPPPGASCGDDCGCALGYTCAGGYCVPGANSCEPSGGGCDDSACAALT